MPRRVGAGGDAEKQAIVAGSWLSWRDTQWKLDDETVTGPDLLARNVYYKVGHHGSHNVTLQKKGLELMTSKDLSAFIPTNKHDAAKIGRKECLAIQSCRRSQSAAADG